MSKMQATTLIELIMYRKVMDATWGKSTAFRKLSREEQNLVLSFINSFGVSCYRQWVADGKRITSSFYMMDQQRISVFG